uniref:Coatomer subunit zeta n=1 Tax=Ascaris lumbricoides TaxID=6252 RepID=A0A0M3I2Q7_ASCLU
LQYYDQELFPTQKEQRAFEKSLFQKTNKANAEIIMLDGLICVYRSNVDLFFYVMGGNNENELILVAALNCLYDSISLVLRKNVEKKALVDNMDVAMLILDEICDNGLLLLTLYLNIPQYDLFEPYETNCDVKCVARLPKGRLRAYYDQELFPTQKEQRAFEKSLFQKTNKANAEIIMLDGLICVYRSNVDLFFYVMGGNNENELILVAALNCLYDSISLVLRKNVEKKALVDNMDVAMLILDEICDNGVLLETEPQAVIGRCAVRQDELTFGDQSISQVGMSVSEDFQMKSSKDIYHFLLTFL